MKDVRRSLSGDAAQGSRQSISRRGGSILQQFPSASGGGGGPRNLLYQLSENEQNIEGETKRSSSEKIDVKKISAQSTVKSLLKEQPPLLDFILATPMDQLPEEGIKPGLLKRLGALGHTAKRFNVHAEKSSWRLRSDDLRSSAGAANASSDYAAKKIAAAARFIDSFPGFSREDVFLSSQEIASMPKDERNRATDEREKHWNRGETDTLPYHVERNRLDDSLTDVAVREVCDAMYDLMSGDGGHGVARDQNIVIGAVEAALMAWDLSSEIQGAWRIPLTLITSYGGRRYSYVCILIHHGARVAAFGRCVLKQLSHIPLVRQRASDVVSRFAAAFVSRGHELQMIYLGLPSECPAPKNQVAAGPLIWRFLKLSCVRQEWMSILATVDLYVAHRRVIRRSLLLGQSNPALPRGFAVLPTQRGKPRLKAAPPTRKQKRRSRRRVPLPPLGFADARKVSDIGAWKATGDEIRQAFYGDMNIPGTGDMEDYSSVSSASLDEFAEDRTLDLCEPVPVEDLKKVVRTTKRPLLRPGFKSLFREKGDANHAALLASFRQFSSVVQA